LVDLPWTWLRQAHGDRVVTVDRPGEGAGEAADAAVTQSSGAVLAVHTADCAPVALVAEGGAVAVVHAGWRGLAAGVVEATVDRLRDLADGPVKAVVGPLIGPECYEFGEDDLRSVATRLGGGVVATTSAGAPALDLPAGVRTALEAAEIRDVGFVGGCTACGRDAFSHRARGERGRQAVLTWIDDGR
jgi:YfiH family protein